MARDGTELERPAIEIAAQSRLQVWLSPSFPVGAFAYSHGLESAVSHGRINSRAQLVDWLDALLTAGSIRNDLILLAAAWRCHAACDGSALAEVNALALALQPSAERLLETSQQGNSFVAAIAAAWPCDAVAALRLRVPGDIAYPVAVATAAAGHGIACLDVARAFALAFVQTIVSAAIRLSVIGQTDGQHAIAALMATTERAAVLACTASLDDLGGAAFASDLAALEHETLYTRLFRS